MRTSTIVPGAIRPCAASKASMSARVTRYAASAAACRVTSMTTAGAISCLSGRSAVLLPVFEKWTGASRCVPPCSGVQSL